MPVAEAAAARRAARPPRPLAWVLLLASAAAVFLVGLAATVLIVSRVAPDLPAVPRAYWAALVAGSGATLLSLALRGLRWAFLLRRANTRIPIRDAYIGYLSGLSLLLAPFLIGEIAVRAFVLRARGRVPASTVVAVNLWERLLDLTALSAITVGAGVALGRFDAFTGAAAGVVIALALPPVRRAALRTAALVAYQIVRVFNRATPPPQVQLARDTTWWGALLASIAAWLLPPLSLYALVRVWGHPYGVLDAQFDYASSSIVAGVMLAPGGVLVAGARWLAALDAHGVPTSEAAFSILGIRLATVGVSTALGVVVLLLHWVSKPGDETSHFDEIADAYDVQIPESRRLALLTRKTDMMHDVIRRFGAGRRGLDVGCGQGAYVGRMRTLGYDATGIDASAGQVAIARRRLGEQGVVGVGSILHVPAADESYDFVYTINVLHHLASVEEQRSAFAELFRVLRPGGLLFVHEINTRNVLFRFYMGYVFPSLNCIDEGVERWLLPNKLTTYTEILPSEVQYFTFFPDFLPEAVVRLLSPVERWLEASALRRYSAHYMAVWQKPWSLPARR